MNDADTLQSATRGVAIACQLVFPTLIAAEWWQLRRRLDAHGYEARDTYDSLALGLVKLGLAGVSAAVTLPLFSWIPPLALWGFALLVLADDLVYYGYHRAAHRVRLLWCGHVVHHSSACFNLSTALRQSPAGPFYLFWFWLPLAWLGFHPAAITLQLMLSLAYQFWIHTETVGRLGWLEHILNTPSHHRVHHGANAPYPDRNFGAILIVWDRLFGTFQHEESAIPVRYGLSARRAPSGLVETVVHEARDLLRAMRTVGPWARWRLALGRPPAGVPASTWDGG